VTSRLQGTRYSLRLIRQEDLPALYQLATAEPVSGRWRYRGAAVSLEQFSKELGDGVLCQFVLHETGADDCLGLVIAYAHDPYSRTAYIAIVLRPECWGSTAAGEALHLMLRHTLRTYNLRKLYAEIPDYNYGRVSSGAGRLFEVEATLKSAQYADGRNLDVHILTVDREEWEAIAGIYDVLVFGSVPESL
jgi:RimJ/RimL family protein N-acetyltransferase